MSELTMMDPELLVVLLDTRTPPSVPSQIVRSAFADCIPVLDLIS